MQYYSVMRAHPGGGK